MAVLDKYIDMLEEENEAANLTPEHFNAWHNNPVTKRYVNHLKIAFMSLQPEYVDYKKALEDLIEQTESYNTEVK